jgi:arylsulfatase A-like enzyme
MSDKRLSVVVLVVDSLRSKSLGDATATPFLDRLGRETTCFTRAYAAECWTLPSHVTMFTGMLPSEHGAHFGSMAYDGSAPTIAELLGREGFATEIVTRNFVFDGTIRGVTRGFHTSKRPVADVSGLDPFALLLALAKPRFRRHMRSTGFFHPLQRENRAFLRSFARSLFPADQLALEQVLEAMTRHRRAGKPYFLFANLYDVHAPYPPTPTSILRSFRSLHGCVENLWFPYFMQRLGCHEYLQPGFHVYEPARRMLLDRYHKSIELMDAKLAEFWSAAGAAGLLDDTVVILTSDHGEAFGEHGLYLHDASVYQTHLHVPLWIHHPERSAATVDDMVSTRDLFGLVRALAVGGDDRQTILHAGYRAAHPIALAEHFHYRQAPRAMPRFLQNIAAAVTRRTKVCVRREGIFLYDLERDPEELHPQPASLDDFTAACRREGLDGAAIERTVGHLRSWRCESVLA